MVRRFVAFVFALLKMLLQLPAPSLPLFTSLPLPVRQHSSQASTLPLATTCSLQQMAFAIFQLNFHSPECLPALYLPHIACARMHVFIFISFSFSSSFSFSLPFNPFEADSFVWQVRARRGCQPSWLRLQWASEVRRFLWFNSSPTLLDFPLLFLSLSLCLRLSFNKPYKRLST